MTVCSVNTGPGTWSAAARTLAEIGNHSPPRHCVSYQIIVVGPVYDDRDSEPSVSAVSPTLHLDPLISSTLEVSEEFRGKQCM